jgi:hypothetical protein
MSVKNCIDPQTVLKTQMCCVGQKSKNILATTSTKTKYALVLYEDDPLLTKYEAFGQLDSDCSQIKEAFLLV